MKYSQFNSVVLVDQDYVMFNSFNHKVIFLVPELNDLLQAAIKEGVDGLKNYHPSFYEYLVCNGFIIDDSIDEVEKVKQLRKSIDENNSDFILTVNPTMNCNFQCWYCYETHIKDSKLDNNNIEKINKLIKKITADPQIKTFSLSFFGGEPLLYFRNNVKPIIDFYTEHCIKEKIQPTIGFTSNGYLINDDFIDYFKEKGITCGLQITLDGHGDDHD